MLIFHTILQNLISIFAIHKKFIDLFLQLKLIDTMDWRASQPIKNLVPKELQWSSISKIGFCGDWFDFDCSRGAETAMNSAINLSKLLI